MLPCRSGLLEEKSQDQCCDDSVKQRFETGLAVRQRTTDIAFGHLLTANTIASQRRKERAHLGDVFRAREPAVVPNGVKFMEPWRPRPASHGPMAGRLHAQFNREPLVWPDRWSVQRGSISVRTDLGDGGPPHAQFNSEPLVWPDRWSVQRGSISVRTTAKAKTATAKTNATRRTLRCSNLLDALAKKSTVANKTVFARY